MINQIEDQLEKFIPSEMWNPSYYQWLLDYIEKPENTKIFFWIENEQLTVQYNVPQNISGKDFFNSKFASIFVLKIQKHH